MNKILCGGIWSEIQKRAKIASQKYAAIAYVTDDIKVKFGNGDVLVTDASDGAIKSGQTSVEVLKAALKRKTTIISIDGLHAKFYIFDKCVIVGSNNLSKGSENLIEVALLTDLPTTVSACRSLIETFKRTGVEVDDVFVSRISKLSVTKPPLKMGSSKHGVEKDPKARTWLVGLRPIVKEKPDDTVFGEKGLEKAQKKISNQKSSVSSIIFSGNSRFRVEAKAGDSVITIWTGEASKRPDYVYHHAPILLREDNTTTDKTHLFVEDYPDADDTTLTWKQFQKLYSRIGIPGKLGQWSAREIAPNYSDALHELWFDQK